MNYLYRVAAALLAFAGTTLLVVTLTMPSSWFRLTGIVLGGGFAVVGLAGCLSNGRLSITLVSASLAGCLWLSVAGCIRALMPTEWSRNVRGGIYFLAVLLAVGFGRSINRVLHSHIGDKSKHTAGK